MYKYRCHNSAKLFCYDCLSQILNLEHFFFFFSALIFQYDKKDLNIKNFFQQENETISFSKKRMDFNTFVLFVELKF